jgi:2-C-methyl-D-erythritol 4-phosphate cytidylyltransferase
MKVAAIVPAAGESRRMGGKIRKPFLTLHGVPILAVTLKNLMGCSQIEAFFVCIRIQDKELCCQEVLPHLPPEKRVEWVEGGERRQDSVYNALLRVGADADLIMIHDAVRPFVSSRMLKIAIEETLRWGATAFGLPAKETVKAVDEKGWVVRTIEREGLWNIQTPQTFERLLLQSAYREAFELSLEATDDASLVERTGTRVKVLLGSPENIKVTTPEDLLLAESIISARDKVC